MGEVFGHFSGIVLSGEAVDEGIGGSEHPMFDFLMGIFGGISGKPRDLFAPGLYEVVEAISAGGETFAEEGDLALVALLVGDGHQFIMYDQQDCY